MMIRALVESVRVLAFGRRMRAIRKRAARGSGMLEAENAMLRVDNVARYRMSGESGDYAIFVVLPAAPPPAAGYPVLYLLDGNAWIVSAAEALRFQSRFAVQSAIEPMMIVAVGYPGRKPFDLGRRAFDFLPKHTSCKIASRFMQGAPWHQPGGAASFLDFLTGPLRTALAERYPVDPARQVLCGHSFGGFFALYALLNQPWSFEKYVALSPSLWWDDGSLLKQADALSVTLPHDLGAELLIAVGGDETPDRPHISARMESDACRFAEILAQRGPARMRIVCRILAGENHQSLPIAMFSAVMRFVSKPGSHQP